MGTWLHFGGYPFTGKYSWLSLELANQLEAILCDYIEVDIKVMHMVRSQQGFYLVRGNEDGSKSCYLKLHADISGALWSYNNYDIIEIRLDCVRTRDALSILVSYTKGARIQLFHRRCALWMLHVFLGTLLKLSEKMRITHSKRLGLLTPVCIWHHMWLASVDETYKWSQCSMVFIPHGQANTDTMVVGIYWFILKPFRYRSVLIAYCCPGSILNIFPYWIWGSCYVCRQLFYYKDHVLWVYTIILGIYYISAGTIHQH